MDFGMNCQTLSLCCKAMIGVRMGPSSLYHLLRQTWSLIRGHAPCANFQACFGKRAREKKSWNLSTFPTPWVRNLQSFKSDLHKNQFLPCKPANEKGIESVGTQGGLVSNCFLIKWCSSLIIPNILTQTLSISAHEEFNWLLQENDHNRKCCKWYT